MVSDSGVPSLPEPLRSNRFGRAIPLTASPHFRSGRRNTIIYDQFQHRHETIMDEARGGHRHGLVLGFRKCEPNVPEGERHSHSWWAESTLHDLAAISLVNPGVEQRICQHVEGKTAIDAALFQQRQNLTHAFERGCGQRIGGELRKIRQPGVIPNREEALAKSLQHRTNFFHCRGLTTGEQEQLALPREIGIAEYRCSNVILRAARMGPGVAESFDQRTRCGSDSFRCRNRDHLELSKVGRHRDEWLRGLDRFAVVGRFGA